MANDSDLRIKAYPRLLLRTSNLGSMSTGISGGGGLPSKPMDIKFRQGFKTPEAMDRFRFDASKRALSPMSSGNLDGELGSSSPPMIRTDLPASISTSPLSAKSACSAPTSTSFQNLDSAEPRWSSAPPAYTVRVADLWANTPDVEVPNPFAQAAY